MILLYKNQNIFVLHVTFVISTAVCLQKFLIFIVMKEIWKPIKGYEGWYEVSNLGRVRSLDRIVTYSDGKNYSLKGKMLKMHYCGSGYLQFILHKNGKTEHKYPHRLVAETFLPNPNNLPEVNHKDENKTNNCVDNLEWCDSKYNKNYGTAIQRMAEKKSKTVLKIDINTNEVIEEYPSAMEAARKLNIYQGNISDCCRGKYKTAYGYKWKYKE